MRSDEAADDGERSFLLSDSEQESSSCSIAETYHSKSNDNNDGVDEWEDFMIRYWTTDSNAANDRTGNNGSSGGGDEEELPFQVSAFAMKVYKNENTDLAPHPLEPELDVADYLSFGKGRGAAANDSPELAVLLSEVGLQSSLLMAKFLSAKQPKQRQLQEEFRIDMSKIPIKSYAKPRKTTKGRSIAKATAAASSLHSGANKAKAQQSSSQTMNTTQTHQEAISKAKSSALTTSPSPVDASTTSMQLSSISVSPQQQQETTLEDSLVAMAQRLSLPAHQHDQLLLPLQQRHNEISAISSNDVKSKSSIATSNTNITNNNYSPLPNPNLILQMGPIQTRTSLRSLLMKKWHQPSWWMHYDTHSILIFRSKDHLDDWVQNPYHGKKEREYLIKLRIDFGDISSSSSFSVDESVRSSGGGGGNNHHHHDGDANNNKEVSSRILGHRILPIKQKTYGKKNEQYEMYQFKLERWTNIGVSVLAAFASEEKEDVQLLHDTMNEIMKICPYGGLHNIEHMLQK
jgi:hypothetical protein